VPKVPYAAFLRVYEPLAAFPEPERSYWAEYAARERLPGVQDELREAMTELLAMPPRAAPVRESGDAYVARVDGVVCVCPWRTRLRAWQAMAEVGHWLMPQPVVDAVLPPAQRDRATEEYDRWRERNPDARPWIRSALWHVPVRWFALFTEEERIFRKAGEPDRGDEGPAGGAGTDAAGEPGGEPESEPGGEPGTEPAEEPTGGAGGERRSAGSSEGGARRRGEAVDPSVPSLRYRTPMVEARRRVARGLRTVRRAMPQGPLGEALTDVGRWLEEFHPRSLVELDYGGLVYTIPEEDLAADRSVSEVAEGLAALARGDLDDASRRYEELTDRWMAVRERQFAN
jgi:hypothetical protein